MCEPISMSIAAGLMIAGAAVSAKASVDAGNYQAQVAENQAKMELWKGQAEEQAVREATQQALGEQRAEYAARGINPNFGTPVNVQAATAEKGELDALTIRVNSKNTAAGLISQGRAAKAAGQMDAISTVLSTAGKVASMWATPVPAAGGTPGAAGAGAAKSINGLKTG